MKHLECVIEDALDMSMISSHKFKVNPAIINIKDLISEVENVMIFQAEQKNISLLVDFDTNVPAKIISDSKRITQVLFNLVGNALKFTQDGHVKIIVSLEEPELLRIAVEDTGIGIKEEDQKKLFKFFGKIDTNRIH